MSANPYDTLLSELEAQAAPPPTRAPKVSAPKPTGNRYGAYEAQTEGDWNISRAPAVKDWYKQTYGRDLPVTAEGQSAGHNRRGLNHADSMDVGLNPTTPEGQAFASYLKQNRIPYLAYDRAVPNAASGAHFHVGHPSRRGSAQSAKPAPANPYDSLLDELETSSPAPTPPSQGEAVGTPHTTGGAATPAIMARPSTLRLEGIPESTNVIDLRPPELVAEANRAGRPATHLNDRYGIARFLEQTLDAQRFEEFARAFAEGTEPADEEALRVYRLFDRERRERPEQFKAAAGLDEFGERFGEALRAGRLGDPLAGVDAQADDEVVGDIRPGTPRIDPYTQEGRAQRDARKRAEAEGGALYRVPVSRAVEKIAKETNTPPEFVETWLRGKGQVIESSPTGYATIPAEWVGQMREDYRKEVARERGSIGVLGRDISEAVRTHSPGELLVGPVEPAARGALRGLDLASRPVQAASGAFWAKVHGADDLQAVKTAWEEFRGENPVLATNVVAEALRESDKLKAINPRLPQLAGFLAEMIADPTNIIPGGLIAKGVTRLGRVAKAGSKLEKVAAGLRDVGVFEPNIPGEAFKAAGAPEVLGDLTRRTVPEASIESLPDVPAGTIPAPRLVKSPQAEPEAAFAEKPPVAAESAQAAAIPEAVSAPKRPAAWQHVTFGRVVEHPNQSGVPEGKVRVMDGDGRRHVIQRSNGLGRGNSLSVPLKESADATGTPDGGNVQPLATDSFGAQAGAVSLRAGDERSAVTARDAAGRRAAEIPDVVRGGDVSAPAVRGVPDAAPVEGLTAPAPKEPWQMTRDEYVAHLNAESAKAHDEHLGELRAEKAKDKWAPFISETPAGRQARLQETIGHYEKKGPNRFTYDKVTDHARLKDVRAALDAGRDVPAEVLKDYPDLAPKAAPAPPLRQQEVRTNVPTEVRSDTRPDEVGGQIGQGREDLGRQDLQQPARAEPKASDGQVARGQEGQVAPPPRNPEQLRSRFKEGMVTHLKLPEHQAEGLATVWDVLDEGLTRGGLERGEMMSELAGVGSGKSKGDVLNQADAPTFYSQLRKVVDEKMPARMKPAELFRMVSDPQKGVKADELKWTGLDDFLREKSARNEAVTKDEVQKFLAENEVRVEEVVKGKEGGIEDARRNEAQQELQRTLETIGIDAAYAGQFVERAVTGDTFSDAIDNMGLAKDAFGSHTDKVESQFNRLREEAGRSPMAANKTKFSQYTLPGAKEGTYRELLLTLPVKEDLPPGFAVFQAENGTWGIKYPNGGKIDGWPTREAAVKSQAKQANSPTYHSSHYDEPNILAHIRFNERLSYDSPQPSGGREVKVNLFGREVAPLLDKSVESPVVGLAHHDQVQRAIVSLLPVDVVNDLRSLKLSPQDLFRNESVGKLLSSAPADKRLRIVRGIDAALGKADASLRAKVLRSLDRGVDEELLPTLRTSDLERGEVARLLSLDRTNQSLAPDATDAQLPSATPRAALGNTRGGRGEAGVADRAGARDLVSHAPLGAEGGGRGLVGRDAELSGARLADLLNRHDEIVRQKVKTGKDNEPKRTLFIEEIQSDWHQAGRKKGYNQPPMHGEVKPQEGGFWKIEWADGTFSGGYGSEQVARGALAERAPLMSGSVPDAPFKKNWHELAMKRILRHAAENGYDRVAWTKGETQAARYDLSKQVKRVSYNYDTKQLTAVDLQGTNVLSKEVALDKLEDYVGKEVAQKFVDAQGEGRKFVSLAGEDLKVGGEGMKGFYDRILPSFAQKYGRKWGAKVGETGFVTEQGTKPFVISDSEGRAASNAGTMAEARAEVKRLTEKHGERFTITEQPPTTERAHSIDITPEMRRSVTQEGQPLFQSEKAATKFLKDGRAVIQALDNPDVSSGLHEVHHVFAPVYARAVLKTPDAVFRETGQAFFKWLGFKDAKEFADLHEGWVSGTLKGEAKSRYVTGQEKGARGWERYMKSGEAPSAQLRQVFADFKQWLTDIYGKITTKGHPLAGKLSPEAIKAWDTVLGAPKGEHGQLIHQLHKAPSEGTPAFFENAAVKRALGLKPDATTADVRAALTEQVGKRRSSHLSPEDVSKWADSKGLQGAAREALDFATGKYRETTKAPTEYQQTGIRKSRYDPTTASVSEAVRAMGGLRITRDNRGEMKRLNEATTGLTRRSGGLGADEMVIRLKEDGYFNRDDDVSAGDLLEMLEEDALGIKRHYSNQREVDYEAEYRREHPDDSTEALESFVMTEQGGILFDKVDEGTATRAELTQFRRLAGEAGVHPEHVRAIVARGEKAKAAGVPDSARSKPEDDFDFRDDPVDDADKPSFLYQSGHPQQLGFVEEGLTQQDASPRGRELAGYNKSQAKDETLRKALGDDAFGRLRGLQESPVARLAVEVERRVNTSNSQNAPDVVTALSKLAELKRQKQTVDDYLNQGSLFGDRELTPAQERILSALDRNPRKVIDEAFPAEAKPQQDMLFQSGETGRVTETPEFKRFFRGSKVVDEKGEPLVVYHGTNKDFPAFTDEGKHVNSEAGHYFTTQPDYASGYAVNFRDEHDTPPTGANVIPAYVRIENPYFMLMKNNINSKYGKFDEASMRELQRRGYDGVVTGMTPYEYEKGYKTFKDAEEVVPFSPEQIKSVNNKGTFSPDNPNILYQSGDTTSRRQRAYRALLEAKGQGSLSPELKTEKPKLTFGEKLADVANAPRSLKSSIDLSAAMRQGAMFTLTHPFRSSRIFFGQQLKSLSNKGYEDFVTKLKADPDLKAMQDSGLHLTSLAEDKIGLREEAFASKLAGKVPLVKRSENAYVTFLDAARSQWFKQLKTQADDAAKMRGKPVTKEQYEVIAKFVNRATGRGDLGKGAINDAAPLLNAVFFAPRYAVSKVQVFDPRTYSRLPPGARKMALRQAVQYFGTIAATATLLKYGFGIEVGTDPEESDFLKVKVGNTRYDLAAGSGQYVTLAARLARNLANRATGTKEEQFKGMEANVTRFLRYKLAPVPAAALNAYQKRDAVGQKTDVPKEALGLVTPIYLQDLYEAFQQEGMTGVAKTAPGFVGIGVQTYGERPKQGKSAVPAPRVPRPPKVPAPRALR